MNRNVVPRISAIIFGLIFIPFGINHLKDAPSMVNLVPIPGGVFWVFFTGMALLLGAIAIIINFQTRLAGYLLGLLLLTIAVSVHLIPFIKGIDADMHFAQFLKDTGLAAAAVFIGSVSHKQL